MGEKKIKVTDKRLFTADGELRSEYRDLEEEVTGDSMAPENHVGKEPETPTVGEQSDSPDDASPSSASQEHGPPTFFDLVGVVAQPIALYLGDAKMPNGETMENLELARLYIDLLEVLAEKSEGNLTADEKGFLTDLLYQLRLRYVQKSG